MAGREMNKTDENKLKKLKRSELLEIMLAQSEQIDELKARVEQLEKEAENREIKFSKTGSLAEAALIAANFFEDVEKAASVYLENIKREAVGHTGRETTRVEKVSGDNTEKKAGNGK